MVKCYKNNKYEYDLHPWLKYCRGAIINTKTNRLVCIPPMKSLEREYEIENVINGYNGEDEYQPLIEGTMINMFYDEYIDKWVVCTKSNIGAVCKFNLDSNHTFKSMFVDAFEFQLSPTFC